MLRVSGGGDCVTVGYVLYMIYLKLWPREGVAYTVFHSYVLSLSRLRRQPMLACKLRAEGITSSEGAFPIPLSFSVGGFCGRAMRAPTG